MEIFFEVNGDRLTCSEVEETAMVLRAAARAFLLLLTTGRFIEVLVFLGKNQRLERLFGVYPQEKCSSEMDEVEWTAWVERSVSAVG